MATEKGIFKDDLDRFAQAHYEMSSWLLKNAGFFVRCFLWDRPKTSVKVTLEQIVTTQTKFIIGFADVVLDYETDCGRKERVLIELKSRLSDPAACMRQLRAYAEYIPDITKTCVIHCDDRYEPFGEADMQMRRFFGSQGIYVADSRAPSFNGLYCALPSGRRKVWIHCAEPYGYNFNITLAGTGFDKDGNDAETQTYLGRELDAIRPFAEFVGFDPAPWYFDWSLTPFREIRGTQLFVDVEHAPHPETAETEESLPALHSHGLSRTLVLSRWP
jgi:hypothetical protein